MTENTTEKKKLQEGEILRISVKKAEKDGEPGYETSVDFDEADKDIIRVLLSQILTNKFDMICLPGGVPVIAIGVVPLSEEESEEDNE